MCSLLQVVAEKAAAAKAVAAQQREEAAIRGFEQAVEARRADVETVDAELAVVQQRLGELQELRTLVSQGQQPAGWEGWCREGWGCPWRFCCGGLNGAGGWYVCRRRQLGRICLWQLVAAGAGVCGPPVNLGAAFPCVSHACSHLLLSPLPHCCCAAPEGGGRGTGRLVTVVCRYALPEQLGRRRALPACGGSKCIGAEDRQQLGAACCVQERVWRAAVAHPALNAAITAAPAACGMQ